MQKDDFRLDSKVRKQINESFEPRDRARNEAFEAAKRRRPPPSAVGETESVRSSPHGRRKSAPPHQPQGAYPPPVRRAVRRSSRVNYENDEFYGGDEIYDGGDAAEPARGRRKHRLLKWGFRIAIFCIVVIFLNIVFLYFRGQLWFNEPRKRDYPVRGAVVDEQLGKIDWDKMAGQNISFVYIRATSGTTENDEQYLRNRKAANHTDLLAGYYHEFDFRTDGEEQAKHFIDKLGDLDGKLRPMVKLTRYGLYRVRMKDEDKVRTELRKFLDSVKEEYGRRCVIQCDEACYEKYIEGEFDNQTIWMISHYTEPEKEDWALWEYNPRVRAAAYSNKKEYYCMTVYRKDKGINNFKKNFLM